MFFRNVDRCLLRYMDFKPDNEDDYEDTYK
jgi:hypothetical protein